MISFVEITLFFLRLKKNWKNKKMPIYEYECGGCDKTFEVSQRLSEAPLSDCPDCGGEVKKLISTSAFHLKGGGWYADGYSGPSNSGSKKNDKKAKSAPPCAGGEKSSCKSCPAAAS